MRCMHGLRYLDGPLYVLTSALQCLTAACETHWMRHVSRQWRAHLMFDVQGHWQCATETGTIYDDVFTGSTRINLSSTWINLSRAWWPGPVSRYTDSPAVPENTRHLFLTLLLITKLHNHSITNHHPICSWCFCIVCYFVSSIVLPIVLFGLTTTKLNKLYYYYQGQDPVVHRN